MTRLHINIKNSDKAIIVINLLKELPFVEIEESNTDKRAKPVRRRKESLDALFGLWENREISLIDIREKAWNRSNDTL